MLAHPPTVMVGPTLLTMAAILARRRSNSEGAARLTAPVEATEAVASSSASLSSSRMPLAEDRPDSRRRSIVGVVTGVSSRGLVTACVGVWTRPSARRSSESMNESTTLLLDDATFSSPGRNTNSCTSASAWLTQSQEHKACNEGTLRFLIAVK